MELYQLRSFVAVAATGNLTQAAQRLFTSQPAVSAHIKALEEELGLQLFNRSARGMQLTENGRILRDKAQQLLDLGQALRDRARSLQQQVHGTLSIGLNSDADYLRLTEWQRTLSAEYPDLALQLVTETSVELLTRVRAGELDCTFYSGPATQPGLDTTDLLSSRALIAGGVAWRKQIESASPQQLADLPWIQPEPHCIYRGFIDELFADLGLKPKHIITSGSEESTLKLMLAGAGLSVIRDDEAQRQSVRGDIVIWPGRSFKLPLRFACSAERAEDPAIKALRHHIVDQFKLPKSA